MSAEKCTRSSRTKCTLNPFVRNTVVRVNYMLHIKYDTEYRQLEFSIDFSCMCRHTTSAPNLAVRTSPPVFNGLCFWCVLCVCECSVKWSCAYVLVWQCVWVNSSGALYTVSIYVHQAHLHVSISIYNMKFFCSTFAQFAHKFNVFLLSHLLRIITDTFRVHTILYTLRQNRWICIFHMQYDGPCEVHTCSTTPSTKRSRMEPWAHNMKCIVSLWLTTCSHLTECLNSVYQRVFRNVNG